MRGARHRWQCGKYGDHPEGDHQPAMPVDPAVKSIEGVSGERVRWHVTLTTEVGVYSGEALTAGHADEASSQPYGTAAVACSISRRRPSCRGSLERRR